MGDHGKSTKGIKVYKDTHDKIALFASKLRWSHQDFVAEAINQLEERVKKEGASCLFRDFPYSQRKGDANKPGDTDE